MLKKIGIFWFRQDLRLNDNSALYELIQKCEKIIPIYIVDSNSELGSASKWWLHNSLCELNKSLLKKNSKLLYFNGEPIKILDNIIKKFNVTNIHWNRLYDKISIDRDTNIKAYFKNKKIEILSFKGSLINEPWTIKNKSNSFFKVFTPYWNNCVDQIKPIKLKKAPKEIPTFFIKNSGNILLEELRLCPKNTKWTKKLSLNWFPGEKKALEVFKNFKDKILENYSKGRDRPDKNYTSRLSPYLHFGEISPEKIFSEISVQKVINFESKKKYLAEIGWREFSYNLLFHYPEIKNIPVQKKFIKFPWKTKSSKLKLWQRGKTGYPIVDAGMIQLYETGWMHNRVRMIVGSFLCKNLLIHWWEGEKWFYDTLVDADLGSNSAGWQWIAGCGADAAPYFRIFNPVTQGEKFDPNGDYVKKYIPELKNIPAKLIHSPWELSNEEQKKYNCIIGKDYPKPIIDLRESRNAALTAFSSLKNNSL